MIVVSSTQLHWICIIYPFYYKGPSDGFCTTLDLIRIEVSIMNAIIIVRGERYRRKYILD